MSYAAPANVTSKNDAMRQPTTSTAVSVFGVATNDSGIASTLPAVKVPCPSKTDRRRRKTREITEHASHYRRLAQEATVPWLGDKKNVQVLLNGRSL